MKKLKKDSISKFFPPLKSDEKLKEKKFNKQIYTEKMKNFLDTNHLIIRFRKVNFFILNLNFISYMKRN